MSTVADRGSGIAVAICLALFACSARPPTRPEPETAARAVEDRTLHGLASPAHVYRDAEGIPYIFADSLEDAIRVQGFETASDRLLPMELERRVAQGRLAELIGQPGRRSDILVRLLGLAGLAERQVGRLSGAELAYYDAYREGINAFIERAVEDHPRELAAIGIVPESWTLSDLMTLQLFRIWSSSTNWRQEILTQRLIDRLGPERAASIAQLTINPDDESSSTSEVGGAARVGIDLGEAWRAALPASDAIGSNAWAATGSRTQSGRAILASDPHLDVRTLPGFWYPVGLFTPELRAIGAGTPGSPGLGIGRTEHIAFAATNGYADVVDLFLETLDPERPDAYLEGAESVRFETREETLYVRDPQAPEGLRSEVLRIRSTSRGPILSDHGLAQADGFVVSLRWSAAERALESLGARELLLARSVDEARAAIAKMAVPLTQVVADDTGRIARIASGWVPIRAQGDGSRPTRVVSGEDAWRGFIPPEEMPTVFDPTREWVGSANHRVVPEHYPYVYSTHFAHSWRYRRLGDLQESMHGASAGDHWRALRDVGNTMAARVVPYMIRALSVEPETSDLARMLEEWAGEGRYADLPRLRGPAVFHAIYREFARLTFEDDLGTDLARAYLDDPYYWSERLVRLVAEDASEWFDDRRTAKAETRDDLFRLAAASARAELQKRLGEDPNDWSWGRLHETTFSSPLRGLPATEPCPGGGTHPARGSGETLRRSAYRASAPYATRFMSSMHFVADFADGEKVIARTPGGVSARCASPHLRDQLAPWLAGEPGAWWFSDEAIQRHHVSLRRFSPGADQEPIPIPPRS